jgi:hypothetical protein
VTIVSGQQSDDSGLSGTTLTPALPSAPTEGNWIVLKVRGSNLGVSNANGWSTAYLQNNSTNVVGVATFYCQAASGQGATLPTITFTVSQTLLAYEVEEHSDFTSSPLDVVTSAGSSGTALTISTGTSASTAQVSEEAISALGANAAPGASQFATTNGFTNPSRYVIGVMRVAEKTLSAIGTVETTYTYPNNGTGTNRRLVAGIATFKKVSDSTPQRMKVWDGSSWVPGTLKVWDGSSWVEGTPKVYTGSWT